MAGTDFYLKKGLTPQFRFQSFGSAGSLAIWTPTTSTKVVLTNLVVASNLGGTFAMYWSRSSGGTKIAEFVLGSSSTITPIIGAIEGTTYDATIWGNVSGGGTDNFKVTAMGFEID